MKNVENIYTLTPLQQGILYHATCDPDSAVYFEQRTFILQGRIDLFALKGAWQEGVNRHGVLRSAFIWRDLDAPVQVVRQQLSLPMEVIDLHDASVSDADVRFNEIREIDRTKNFNLEIAPLMRLTIVLMPKEETRMIWSHHHIILDGWSCSLLTKEISVIYAALLRGNLPQLPSPPPFRDYVELLSTADIKSAREFWSHYLQGIATATPTPSGRTQDNSAASPDGVSIQNLRLSVAKTQELTAFARTHRLTVNTILQSAWALLLHFYSQTSDVLFGATVSERPSGFENGIGLFINTLPVRVRIGSEKMLTWMARIQVEHAEARQFSYPSLVQIQEWSDISRGIPLFSTLFVFENYPLEASCDGENYTISLDANSSFGMTNYPLAIAVLPGDELVIRAVYKDARFDSQEIDLLLRRLEHLLQEMLATPDCRLSELTILSPTERHKILNVWNDTGNTYKPSCIHHRFFEQVKRSSDAVAIAFDDQRLTYRELNARSNQLAHYLLRLGVEPDVCVGICLERGPEMIVCLLAILKAGGAYVPIDPSQPAKRLKYMLDDSKVKLLLTRATSLNREIVFPGTIVCLDHERSIIAACEAHNPISAVLPDNLAYVIYTSGSTGSPKGVMISHKGLCNVVEHTIEAFQIDTDSQVLQFASLSFDASVWQIFMALHAGATLNLPTQEQTLSVNQLNQLIHDRSITVCDLPPFIVNSLQAEKVKSLTTVSTGGEPCPVPLARRWSAEKRFYNVYGPTECTVVSSWRHIESLPPSALLTPIGGPISNVRMYILDSSLRLTPPGIAGELHIGGIGLSRGYVGRPDSSAERFIPNAFSRQPGERLYKTGDLAKYDSSGAIEFLGRVDHQVKIRGFRIELGEIENALSYHPDVNECAVLTRDGEDGVMQLVAFIGSDRQSLTVRDLRDFLRRHIPEYMIPSQFVIQPKLKLLPSGKIDRKTLALSDATQHRDARTYAPPRTPSEELIAEIWQDVLKVDKIGIYDNFFELGGHSLIAMQLVTKLEETLGMSIGPSIIFRAPTIDDMMNFILETHFTDLALNATAD